MQLNLVPHPSTPPGVPISRVWANVELVASFGAMATMNIWFGIGAPAGSFVIPEADEPSRADGLWQTTCLEAFIREAGHSGYREWNFAPSGEWAAYNFSSYREGMAAPDVGAPPYIRFEDNLTWWALGVTIAVEAGKHWDLGLSAVLEEAEGTKSYWALAHGDGRPDFHHPDCFTARLP